MRADPICGYGRPLLSLCSGHSWPVGLSRAVQRKSKIDQIKYLIYFISEPISWARPFIVHPSFVLYFCLQVSLVVNVASECGFTNANYKELVNLQDLYSSRGFTILAFPCNQFGQQEPATNKEIWDFADKNYNVNFPIFAKIDVKGERACEVYEYLTVSTGSTPTWNFCKYLVNQQGEVVQYFSQTEPFSDIRESLKYMLESRSEL